MRQSVVYGVTPSRLLLHSEMRVVDRVYSESITLLLRNESPMYSRVVTYSEMEFDSDASFDELKPL